MRCGLLLAVLLAAPAAAQVTSRVSVSSSGVQGAGDLSGWLSVKISPDGRFVVFVSEAPELVPGDTNGVSDVFVRDRLLGTTERVSVDSNGVQGNAQSGSSLDLSITPDGRYVGFLSFATNLVPGDSNGFTDAFVHDRATGTTELVSVDSSGAQGNHVSGSPSISADGRYVAFGSFASNLVPGDTNVSDDIFVRDRVSGTTVRINLDPFGGQTDRGSIFPSISADGRLVAYLSLATNLVPGGANSFFQAYVTDWKNGRTTRASVGPAGVQANGSCEYWAGVSLSADGGAVVFSSEATNLVPGDTNGELDVFVRDLRLGTTERVSVSTGGSQADDSSGNNPSSISGDGRFVAFLSLASNLVVEQGSGSADVFVHDRATGTTELASLGSHGEPGDRWSGWEGIAISDDGGCVAFFSFASNLVPEESNSRGDFFLRERDPHVFPELCLPGQSGVAACPCSNPPSSGDRGCDNSAATGGARLSARGGEYLSSDSLVFTTEGEFADKTSILFQGDDFVPVGVVHGHGVRCVAGSLKRLYTKSASAGSITAPDLAAGDPTVHTRSAALGDAIQSGSTRWYFVVYRDPAVFPGCAPEWAFNSTQTIEVSWRP